MLLKLILLGVIAVVVYRAFGGKVPILDGKEQSDDTPSGDTLVECATCGTYVTIKESITVGSTHYCSKECLPN